MATEDKDLGFLLRRVDPTSPEDIKRLLVAIRRQNIYTPLVPCEDTYYRIRREDLYSNGKASPAFVVPDEAFRWESLTALFRHLNNVGRFGGGVSSAYADSFIEECHVNVVSQHNVREVFLQRRRNRNKAEEDRRQHLQQEHARRQKEEQKQFKQAVSLVESSMSLEDFAKVLSTSEEREEDEN